MARRPLIPLLVLQAIAHLFWLSPAAHSGQVAIPWLMNRGFTLFGDILEQHAPGSSVLAALLQGATGVDPGALAKLLNIALVVATTALVYSVARSMAGDRAGLLGAMVYAWWQPVYGNVLLYFDSLLALCVLAALAVVVAGGAATRRLALAGLLMGAATLFKQHAWLSLAAMALWLWHVAGRRGLVAYFAAAMVLPLLQWALLAGAGVWEGYVFWNWSFNLSGAMDGVALDGDFFRKLLLTNVCVAPFCALAWRRERRSWLIAPLLWLASLILLFPRVGEIHVMGGLALTAVMSGVVLARLLPVLREGGAMDLPRTMLAGLVAVLGIGWLWTGAVSYLHIPLGPGAIQAYDEFRPLGAQLQERAEAGDTLFILPETDSTPQLHVLSALEPPGTWIKGWHWYFRPPQVLPMLLEEWSAAPPDWIVVFPYLTPAGEPGILELQAIVEARYELAFESAAIFDHGRAHVYRLSASA